MVFDTTLRDGEQSPGATLAHNEKILIAKQLEKLGVDVIEAGFPIASEDDFKAVEEISRTIAKPVIVCGLARCVEKDIETAARALEGAKKPRLHVFLATSPIHMKYKLKKSPREIIADAVKGVKFAKQFFDDVEFSPEDASRTKKDFLFEVVEKTIGAGATTVNIPDTVGYSEPLEYGALIKSVKEKVSEIGCGALVSVHCHNDLGLATANSLEAIRNGADQVECTINGIGERAGNASLEEIVMNLNTRKDYFGFSTGIKLSEIYPSSLMVSNFTGIVVQPNKAVVGRNAFAHEAGVHQHGVLSKRESYEIMNPEIIGKETELVIGKHSGKHAVEDFLKKKGFSLTSVQRGEILSRVKSLADKQKIVMSEDISAIANEILGSISESEAIIVLEEAIVSTGNKVPSTAKVNLVIGGKSISGFAKGVGPVDALSKAIESAIGDFTLKEYNLKAISKGTDALAEVLVVLSLNGGKDFSARAVSEDVIMASAKAIVKALNLAFMEKRGNS